MLRCILFSSIILACSGCYASEQRATPPSSVTSDLTCAPEELQLAWASDDGLAIGYHPVSLDVAAGGALLVRTSSRAFELEVIADDGLRSARTTTRIEIGPPR